VEVKLLALAALFGSVSATSHAAPSDEARPASCKPAAVGADSFCSVSGVRLHYVDWGGKGSAIILLTGLGDSARIFDDLAPRLARGHRVIAVTRRGYGLSDHSQSDYSNAALVGDVLGLMDALAIPKASFVGHSIAGGELSTLGARHADRVERLVYLDSAYDRTRALELTNNVPKTAGPTAADMASIGAMVRWREAVLGTNARAVRENIIDTMRDGRKGLASATPPSVMLAVLGGDVAAKPDYSAIAAPSLALYSSKDVAEQVPPGTSVDVRRNVADYEIHTIRPWMLREQAGFLEHKKCGVAVELPHSTHYFFLTSPDWTARTILKYFAAADPCHWSPTDFPGGD
jgi:pimeloyl-ACP methyl ester carboxylesterase